MHAAITREIPARYEAWFAEEVNRLLATIDRDVATPGCDIPACFLREDWKDGTAVVVFLTAEQVSAVDEERGRPAWAEGLTLDVPRLVERLTPIAQELATQMEPRGITLRQLRGVAVNKGVLTGEERADVLESVLVQAMQEAGLSEGTGRAGIALYRKLIPLEASA